MKYRNMSRFERIEYHLKCWNYDKLVTRFILPVTLILVLSTHSALTNYTDDIRGVSVIGIEDLILTGTLLVTSVFYSVKLARGIK